MNIPSIEIKVSKVSFFKQIYRISLHVAISFGDPKDRIIFHSQIALNEIFLFIFAVCNLSQSKFKSVFFSSVGEEKKIAGVWPDPIPDLHAIYRYRLDAK